MQDRSRILIVDDDPGIVAMLSDLLSPLYNVSHHSNAADAIQQLNWEPADLLILDLNMPILAGEEAIRLIRERPAGKPVPILVISADPLMQQRILDSNVQAILAKPFSTETLLQVVEELLL